VARAFDVAIVGGGVMGLSSAYFLAVRGATVAVLDRGPLAREASWLNAGGVRQSNRDPRELPLALAAMRLWPTLAERLGHPTGFRQGGNLRLALDEEERKALRASVAAQQQGGLDIRWLEPHAARAVVPRLSEAVLGATHCPSDGQAEPALTTSAWVRAVEREGATLLPHREVVGVELRGGRVAAVSTAGGRFEARVVLNAAGPWSPAVGALVGVRHPVDPWLAEVLEYDLRADWLTPFLSWRLLSFRGTLDGRLWAALSSRPYGRFERGELITPEGAALLEETARRILAPLDLPPPRRAWNGITEWTPDAVPIIDAACGPEGYVVATGFSGHGFALHPAVGLVVSELILDGRTSIPLGAFRNDRFGR
jgi:sarcosine oxidase subunit beta